MNISSLSSRRSFLKAAPAAAILGALPASAAVVLITSELPDLIARHTECDATFEAASRELEAAEIRFDKTPSPLTPLSVTPDGRSSSGSLEFRIFNVDAIKDEIHSTYASLVERHCSHFVRLMAPGQYQAMLAALGVARDKALLALSETIEAERQLEVSTGLYSARIRYDETREALKAATLDVMAYWPRSAGDAQLKGDWLQAVAKVRKYHFDMAELQALFAASARVEA